MPGLVVVVITLLIGVAIGLLVARRKNGVVRSSASTPVPGAPTWTAQVERLLAAHPGLSLLVDPSDVVVRSSPSARAIGLVRGEAIADEHLRTTVRQVRREGGQQPLAVVLPPRPPSTAGTPVELSVARISDDLVAVLGEDRSEQQRIDATRRDFVVNVSHELKTPVGGLVLLAEAVSDAREDPVAVARFAGRMQVEAQRLAQLVGEVVDLSRLQVTDTVRNPQRVHLNACVRQARDELHVLASAKGITLDTSPDPSDPVVFGEHGLLVTAVRNLLSNAITYSESGTRVATTVRRAGDEAEVVVADQGVGIPAGEQERVFERFYRVDAARSRATGGTGLGLAIVKHVAVNHGGRITVWSEPGSGSTFTLRLPTVPRERTVHARTDAAPHAPLRVANGRNPT